MAAETHVMGRKRAGELLHAALTVLKDNNGEMRGKQVLREIEKRVKLSDYERERHEKSGYIRWESVVHFYSIDAVKAGFLRKHKGVWYLTPEGEKALKLSPKDFIDLATAKYREWKKRQDEQPVDGTTEEPDVEVGAPRGLAASQAIDQAKEEIADFVQALNEYDFQDLVAALLRGMGYHTPFIAQRGRADGGIDILAYSDPLGGSAPRFKVQVKHHEKTVGEKDVRDLSAVLSTPGDVGLFVSSSGFSEPAKTFARNSAKHMELVDLNRFIELWDQYYDELEEEDKQRLPLRRVSFLAAPDAGSEEPEQPTAIYFYVTSPQKRSGASGFDPAPRRQPHHEVRVWFGILVLIPAALPAALPALTGIVCAAGVCFAPPSAHPANAGPPTCLHRTRKGERANGNRGRGSPRPRRP